MFLKGKQGTIYGVGLNILNTLKGQKCVTQSATAIIFGRFKQKR